MARVVLVGLRPTMEPAVWRTLFFPGFRLCLPETVSGFRKRAWHMGDQSSLDGEYRTRLCHVSGFDPGYISGKYLTCPC